MDARTGFDGSGKSDASSDARSLPFLDLPFTYTIDGGRVVIQTDGGDLYGSLGPWGAHFAPNAGGHAYGDPKTNSAAYFTADLGELTNIDGGICHPGDSCQLAEAVIAGKVPSYIAPLDGTVTAVQQDHAPAPIYYPNNVQVAVRMTAGPYELLLGHMRGITPELRDKVLQATCAQASCVDVDTWQEGGAALAAGLDIPVVAGEALGYPQTVAVRAPTEGYFQGAGIIWIPWVEIEFFVSRQGETLCYFDTMDPAKKSALQATLDRDMSDLDSVRYGPPWFQSAKWQWGAEGRLCGAHSVFPMDHSSLYTYLGGWFQRPSSDGGTAEEVVAFVAIAKDTPAYDAARYSSASVNTLVVRTKPMGSTSPFSFALPDAGTIEAARVDGELLEETPSTLLIRWRDVRTMQQAFDVYQRAVYSLGPSGLMMRWGQAAASRAEASFPMLAPGDTCASVDVHCYDHQPSGHF